MCPDRDTALRGGHNTGLGGWGIGPEGNGVRTRGGQLLGALLRAVTLFPVVLSQ